MSFKIENIKKESFKKLETQNSEDINVEESNNIDHHKEYKNEPEINLLGVFINEPQKIQQKENELQCNICKIVYKYKKNLMKHMEIHSRPKFEEKCKKCGKIFKNQKVFTKHNCSTVCSFCSKKLSTKGILRQHLKNLHHTDLKMKIFKCDFCGEKLKTRTGIINHIMLHQKNEKIKNFECDFDGKLFKKKLGLYQHMKQRHQIQACKICGIKVKGMNYHLLRCNSDDNKTFPCPDCNKKFSANCLLNHHKKNHEKKFNCNFCGRNFAHLSTLKEHEEFHKNPKAYQCQICGNCSKRKGDLKKHLKTHDKNREKSLKCHQCNYSTDHKTDMRKHQKIHERPLKNLKCNQCDYKTYINDSLRQHLKTHESNREKFSCPYCEFKAKRKTSLEIHLNVHNSKRLKNFKCQQSEYKTDFKKQFNVHMRNHENGACLKCEKCNYLTKSVGHFREHLKVCEKIVFIC